MMEEWRPISECDFVEVSNLGRLRRCKDRYIPNVLTGGMSLRLKNKSGFIYSPSLDHDGYRIVVLRIDGKHKKWKMATLVCKAFHGEKPSPDYEVCHRDGTRDNDNENNLYWGTKKENARDRAAHGNTVRGTKMHTNKLQEDDVFQVRALLQEGISGYEIANQFGVSQALVQSIKHRRVWAWL